MIAKLCRTRVAKGTVFFLSNLLALTTSQVAFGQTYGATDEVNSVQMTVDVDGAGLEPGFPAKLRDLGGAALEGASKAWQASVAVPQSWELLGARFVLVRQPDGFDVSLAAEAMVRYQDVVLDPSATGDQELLLLEHDAYTFEDVHAYFVNECARVADDASPPRGQRIVSKLVGERTQTKLFGYLYPFVWAHFSQNCGVQRSNLPSCLQLANHPQNCQYAPRIRHISMRQNVSCRLRAEAYTCEQTQAHPLMADMSAAILALVADDKEGA